MGNETDLRELVARALAEDVGKGDVTAQAAVRKDATARAEIVQKEPGVVFGLGVAEEAFRQMDAESFERTAPEGRWQSEVPAGIARIAGPARGLLTAERTALNLLCHLSGIATLTARFVHAVEGSGVKVLDTRKTIPGLRALEKAAVAAGGGINHRMGLDQAILIKDNHAALAGGVGKAVRRVQKAQPKMAIEVECRNVGEVGEAVAAGAPRLLLDNMTPEELRVAVTAARTKGDSPELEASGGITLENAAAVAATGVDFISVGALTHSAPALDLSLEMEAT
jgi:nicotinate-nucleotide pyrophosphorylase (carboxylating)